MINTEIRCPHCGETDMVEKVSTVYLMGIGLSQQAAKDEDQPAIPFKLSGLPESELRSLARRLKPPASSRRMPTRPLHPDLYVLTFSLVIPIFLYGIYSSQRASLLPILVFLAGLYSLYFWKRKPIVARFARRQAELQTTQQHLEGAIGRWMKLYYCARDDGVFEPGKPELTPADQLHSFITAA